MQCYMCNDGDGDEGRDGEEDEAVGRVIGGV